ncbi:hypothetical protein FE784_11770 [Paenibacillus hemerocallicola]|uniref:Uncharacterized protein n=1 Tax=Paenibacillus hemerocallicola TaxID=1172614 RepID=A0A5C4TAX6_9BACL|nr:hypothetical protein [Paenibacillus hemerocallicola]TNJ66091.1 hypothetical protein FE784_11770 [Paenibacillus hemerocallicola]
MQQQSAHASEIIVDNDQAGFTRSEFAATSNAGNKEHYGSNYRYDGDTVAGGSQWAKWTPTIGTAGTYKIYMKWSSHTNRPQAAPIEISYNGGASVRQMTVDQRMEADNWHYLGEYELKAGTGNYVKITDASAGATIADAVKFAYVEETAITIDNDTAGFTRNGFDTVSSGGNGEQLGVNYRQDGSEASGGSQWAQWTPAVTAAGNYKVYMKWSSFANRPDAAPVQVVYNGGAQTFNTTVNQQLDGSNWHYLGDFQLAAGSGNYVRVTDADSGYTVADAVKFVYSPWDYADDFEDESIGSNPSHWIEKHTLNRWSVVSHEGSHVYKHTPAAESTHSWLHVFERDVEFSARFKVLSHNPENAKIRLSVRYNDEEAQIYAGYDFVNAKWHIKERRGEDFEWVTLAESAAETLSLNTWYTIKAVTENNQVQLYVNDMRKPKLTTAASRHQSPGRVALSALGTEVYFDQVRLKLNSGQGRLNDGVLEYTLGSEGDMSREGASIVEKLNGDLVLLHRKETFLSTDDGQTFQPTTSIPWPKNGHSHYSVIRLQSGKLLNMVAEYNMPNPKFDSPLRFRAKLSSDDGATWTNGGLTWTAYREGVLGESEAIVMNDKLTQMPDGRIFFVVGIREDDGTKVIGHKSEVYYSDDEGATWHQSVNDTDSVTSLVRYAEGKVIATADGKLRLYTPWNEADSVRYSVSTDNGVTWAGDYPLSSMKNSRSSFAVIQDPYASTLTYYMVWVYNDKNDYDIVFLPRSRLALARSYDGINWEYMMDVERWISPDRTDGRAITQILDPSLTATQDYLYVTIGRSEKIDESTGHNFQRLRVYRIDKSKLFAYEAWPTEY